MTSCNLLLDQLTAASKTGNYRQLQAALKDCKASGYKVECRLNDSKVTLKWIAQNLIINWYKLAPEPKPAKRQRKSSLKAEKAFSILSAFPDVQPGRYSVTKAEPMYKHLQACGWRWKANTQSWTHK